MQPDDSELKRKWILLQMAVGIAADDVKFILPSGFEDCVIEVVEHIDGEVTARHLHVCIQEKQ